MSCLRHSLVQLSTLTPVTPEEVDLVTQTASSATGSLGVAWEAIGGCKEVPLALKKAVMHLLLKGSLLESSILDNYHLVPSFFLCGKCCGEVDQMAGIYTGS